jgi:hypothetical protein
MKKLASYKVRKVKSRANIYFIIFDFKLLTSGMGIF